MDTDSVQQIEDLRRSTHELYSLLAGLGERFFLEAMCMCDSEKEAAAWASANLVASLQERQLLARVAAAP